jgi:hypothetical protein
MTSTAITPPNRRPRRKPARRAAAAALAASALAYAGVGAGAAEAYSERSVGSPQQVAWVRTAAARFVAAELRGDGAGACAILDARLRFTRGGRTCEQRWTAKLARLLHEPVARARLRRESRAVGSARVVVRGEDASIELPLPLDGGPNRFRWTENCWMLES